jgi:hypothetical protein
MHHRVTFTQQALRTVFRDLARLPGRVVNCPAGVSRLEGDTTLLVSDPAGPQYGPQSGLRTVLACSATENLLHAMRRARERRSESSPTAVVGFGLGEAAGEVAGFITAGDAIAPIDEVRIIDAGMPRISLSRSSASMPELLTSDREIWSRTIGALSEPVWRRLTELHFGIIGCGRTGAEMTTALAGLGIRKLTIIDGDTLELSNIGEIFPGVSTEHVGMAKTEVLARMLSGAGGRRLSRLSAVAGSISSQAGLVAAKGTDVLICCVDHPTARAAAAFLAKLYLKPLLDIGTGIHRRTGGAADPRFAADVRLVLPDRCLLCFGGIRRIAEVHEEFRRRRVETTVGRDSALWSTLRAGSLRSLNMVAAGLAIRLLEDFVGQRVESSHWIQADYQEDGRLAVHAPETPENRSCSMCRFTGFGDDGLSRFGAALGFDLLE